MSVVDELNAEIAALDRILAKVEKADAADKPKLEAAATSAQVKVQAILLAISQIN